MSQPTIGRIVESLLKAQTLAEIDESPKGNSPESSVMGRPSRLLALNATTPRFLGIQLGVRVTRLSLLATAPPPDERWQDEFVTGRSPAQWKERLKKALGKLEIDRLQGTVVSLPGVVDERAGRVLFSPNLRWTEELDFASVTSLARMPLRVAQEIRLLALGHAVLHPEWQNFLLVDVGSGVGAAIVRDGALMSSALPLSGELGHSPVMGNERPCKCGARGCVETLVSRNGLLTSATEHRWPDQWPLLMEKLRQNDPPAWLKQSLDALATTISAALNIVGLDRVAITGVIRELPEQAQAYLQQRIEQGTMWRRFGAVSSDIAGRHRTAGMTVHAISQFLLADSP
jgi:predicted NBD/HSP70 family sugar kinase